MIRCYPPDLSLDQPYCSKEEAEGAVLDSVRTLGVVLSASPRLLGYGGNIV